MDLLETILRSSGFEEYHDVLKKNGIDSYTLKILNDQDLMLIGIQDEEKRQQFLKVVNNLQIPSEKKLSVMGDKSYALIFLYQLSFQLQKQMANLTYVLKREDVDLCNVKLTPAILSLQNALASLENQVDVFERQVLKVNKRSRKKYTIISSLLVVIATITTYRFCILKI